MAETVPAVDRLAPAERRILVRAIAAAALASALASASEELEIIAPLDVIPKEGRKTAPQTARADSLSSGVNC